MASAILKRILRVFRAKAHDALDNVEQPGSTARELVRELRRDIAITEEAVAAVLADQKTIQTKRDAAQADVESWNGKAEQAVIAKRDDLAQAAIERALRAERNVKGFDASLEHLAPRVAQLRERLDELRVKLNETSDEADMLDARAKVALASGRTARLLGSVGESVVDFQTVRDRVQRMEAQSDALNELAQDKSGERLDAELASLSTPTSASRLAEIKQRVQSSAEAGT